MELQQATLCIIRNKDKILLGMKKRGFGEGKWNGFGGKPEEGESIEDCAHRELQEEVGLTAKNMKKMGAITFNFKEKPEWDQVVHLFLVEDYDGEPEETEEMKPKWYHVDDIPYEKMWVDDIHWLPLFLDGKEIKGNFVFNGDNTIDSFHIE